MPWFGFNGELAVDELHPLAHAGQADARGVTGAFRLEADAVILDGRLQARAAGLQVDVHVAGAGVLGENISTRGMTEATVCLGDRFQLGSALLEISQGRQPCWKLNDRFSLPDMARRVQTTGRCGWYYRVLQAGDACTGDTLTLRERPHPDWPLTRLTQLLYGRALDPAQLKPALVLPLVPSWRKLIERRLQQGTVEDWDKRINGPMQD